MLTEAAGEFSRGWSLMSSVGGISSEVLLLNILAVGLAVVLFRDVRRLPLIVLACLAAVFVSTPVAVVMKGIKSAVYVVDLMPLVLVPFLLSAARRRVFGEGVVLAVAMLLLVVPAVVGGVHYLVEGAGGGLWVRGAKEFWIWYYRNAILWLFFVAGVALRLDARAACGFVRANVGLGLVVGTVGLFGYSGVFDLAVFDRLAAVGDAERLRALGDSGIGAGFFGLFRGAVGQFFGSMVVLAAGAAACFVGARKVTALIGVGVGIGVVVLSQSRAGLVGMAVGLMVLGVVGRDMQQRVVGVVALLGIAGWVWWTFGEIGGRLESGIHLADQASAGRVLAWGRSLDYLWAHPGSMAIGVGPTDRAAIHEVTGAFGAHNEYIDSVFRGGVIGVASLLAVLLVLFRKLRGTQRLAEREVRTVGGAMLAVFLGNVVMGLTQGHLLRDYSDFVVGALIFLWYGVGVGLRRDVGAGGSVSEGRGMVGGRAVVGRLEDGDALRSVGHERRGTGYGVARVTADAG